MTRLLTLVLLAAVAAAPMPAPAAAHAQMKRDAEDPVLAAYVAANPRLAALMDPSPREVEHYAALAGRGQLPSLMPSLCDANGTDYNDIKQTTLNDCWLASTMLTMAYVNPWWPISRFTDVDRNKLAVPNATVKLTPPAGGEFTHTFAVASLHSAGVAFSTADEHWWPAAIEDAVLAYGRSIGKPGILVDGGKASEGMTLLTGIKPTFTPEGTPQDEVFLRLQNPGSSPILLTSKAATPKILQQWHTYAVLGSAADKDGKQRVLLRNPLGFALWYYLNDIYGEIANVVYLPNGEHGPD